MESWTSVNRRVVVARWDSGIYPNHSEEGNCGTESDLSWWNIVRALRHIKDLDKGVRR